MSVGFACEFASAELALPFKWLIGWTRVSCSQTIFISRPRFDHCENISLIMRQRLLHAFWTSRNLRTSLKSVATMECCCVRWQIKESGAPLESTQQLISSKRSAILESTLSTISFVIALQ